ncbi:GGDEF domain-containing protein [Phytobacter ursingii]|uniref:GGDEF domain-containing protein n=1 Tax=Phytobacter ursingii TaxID=1972431 RepID=UPI000CD0E4E6|nr:GGDEF domain-containing protein [Enterobacteriaceae bacterium ENNIH1]RDT49825.1 GGDEF domain-containing protein [Escherichia coli]
MTPHSWQSLCNKKYRLSVRLFLLLNTLSALFSIALPLYNLRAFTLPICLILVSSLAGLLWHWKFPKKKINITLISFLFGCMWAWHIIIKSVELRDNDSTYLLIALLSVLFIGSLAFSNNIIAFMLHSSPTFMGCFWLSSGEITLRIIYAFALPMIGIAIQHVIQKRNDNFSQALMYRLMQERKTLNDLSMLDPLTGLYNRRGLQNKLDNLLALDDGTRFVLLLDIDHFKAYNDHYGHMMGDQALIRVSAAIRNAVRSRDIVARFGGEEFLILLNSVDLERARLAAERIRQHVYDLKIPHMFNESVATNVTVSIGIAPLEDGDIDDALDKADKALYEAKHQGRNSILVSSDLQVA